MFPLSAGQFFELELQMTSTRSMPSYILLASSVAPVAILFPSKLIYPHTFYRFLPAEVGLVRGLRAVFAGFHWLLAKVCDVLAHSLIRVLAAH